MEIVIIMLLLLAALVHRKFQWDNSTEILKQVERDLRVNHIKNVLEITYDVKIYRYSNDRNNKFVIRSATHTLFYLGKTKNSTELTEDNLFKFEEIYDFLNKKMPNRIINLTEEK